MTHLLLDINHIIRGGNPIQFLFWPLVISMIIIGLVRMRSPKIFFFIFKIAESNSHLHLYLREGFNINGISSLLLQLNYFLVLGTVFYSVFFHYNNNTEINYLVLVLVYFGPPLYYLVKFMLVKVFEYLTETSQGYFEYLANYKVFFQIQGIVFLPLSVLLIFTGIETQKYLVFIIIGFLVLLSIFRTTLSILYGLRYGFSFIYIFLYLCTLEILPLVVLFKLFNVRMVGVI